MENNVKKIHDFDQSIWLDFIDRKIMNTGELQKLIDEDGVRGLTSNPAIFEKAISSGSDYDEDIKNPRAGRQKQRGHLLRSGRCRYSAGSRPVQASL